MQLIDAGYISEYEVLYDKNGKEIASIAKNNKVLYQNEEYSIHKLSAKLLNKSNNNGWSYFFIKRNDKLICIDDLRYKFQNKE